MTNLTRHHKRVSSQLKRHSTFAIGRHLATILLFTHSLISPIKARDRARRRASNSSSLSSSTATESLFSSARTTRSTRTTSTTSLFSTTATTLQVSATTSLKPGYSSLLSLITRLNSDVLRLRNQIELSISNRCASIPGCYHSSYDECQSELDSGTQTCPSLGELGFSIGECGRGEKCNGLFDWGVTTVRIPEHLTKGENRNPTDPALIETVCYTRTAQKWMVDKYNDEKPFWASLNVTSPQMYFGSSNGVFRIHPARHSRECGQYDARTRPWYKNAVPTTVSNIVKPRHVVILMDTSRSMAQEFPDDRNVPRSNITKLHYMQQAVTSTLKLLSEKDSVAVIRFGEAASLVGRPEALPPHLWQNATAGHVAQLVEDVNKIEVRGRSNWMTGFQFAFNLIENSLRKDSIQADEHCNVENVAVLFFSDGEYNLPEDATDEDVVDLVSKRVKQVEAMGDYHVHSFLYSLGYSKLPQVAKEISCKVDGIWKYVSSDVAPGNVTAGYQTMYSTLMGRDTFYNFTTWSDPYVFVSTNETGYTVSAIVYNRDVEPPRFEGAVGMDVSAEAARRIYGGTLNETAEAIKNITRNITATNFIATCEDQRLNLTYCEVQSIRAFTGGHDSICLPSDLPPEITPDKLVNLTDVNETSVTIEEVVFDVFVNCSKAFVQQCPGKDEYPDDLWKNVNLKDQSFEARVCCEVGTSGTSDQCPKLDEIRDTRISDQAIFGIIFVSLVVVEAVGCFFCFYMKKRGRA